MQTANTGRPAKKYTSRAAALDRVESALRALVQEGRWQAGMMLPSRRDLAELFDVDVNTIQRAIAPLLADGTLRADNGRGTFVAEAAVPSAGPQERGAMARARRNTVAVFAQRSNIFASYCVERLNAQAALSGLAVECRYADATLTPADVIQFEALCPVGFLAIGGPLAWVAELAQARGHRAVVRGDTNIDSVQTVPTISSDVEHGGRLATGRLIELGHRRIAFLSHFADVERTHSRRWVGHESALREAGLDGAATVLHMDSINEWVAEPTKAQAFFARPEAPTGVVVWTDYYAVRLVGALQRAGLRVPEDVSVIGYDNLPLSRDIWPTLDTVDQHLDAQLRHALMLLTAPDAPPGDLDAPAEPIFRAVVTPTLITRASCAPPRDR